MDDVWKAAVEQFVRDHVALNLTDVDVRVPAAGIIVPASQRGAYCSRSEVPERVVKDVGDDKIIFVPCAKGIT